MNEMTKSALAGADTPINRARQRVLADCRSGSKAQPGFLTVPTEEARHSSMAFALEHAVKFGESASFMSYLIQALLNKMLMYFEKSLAKAK